MRLRLLVHDRHNSAYRDTSPTGLCVCLFCVLVNIERRCRRMQLLSVSSCLPCLSRLQLDLVQMPLIIVLQSLGAPHSFHEAFREESRLLYLSFILRYGPQHGALLVG